MNDSIRKEKILDDRLKMLTEEKVRVETQLQEKIKKKGEESEDTLRVREIRIKSLET